MILTRDSGVRSDIGVPLFGEIWFLVDPLVVYSTNSGSIRFDARRETKTETNEFSANVDLLPATVSESDQVLLFTKEKKGVRSLIHDFGPRI